MKSKQITRNCLVCGKRIRVTVYEDGTHKNGYFFGDIKLPLKGTGEYKKTGTCNIGGNEYEVAKWTGKEKEMEYWECTSCCKGDEVEN
jgi:hypothetical protein